MSHRWVPVQTHSTPVLPKQEEAVGCSTSPQPRTQWLSHNAARNSASMSTKGEILVADIECGNDGNLFECKGGDISQRKWRIHFPVADGRIKTLGRRSETENIHFDTGAPIQRESNIDFLAESEGSLPQPHDSVPDAGEAINDFLVFVRKLHMLPSR